MTPVTAFVLYAFMNPAQPGITENLNPIIVPGIASESECHKLGVTLQVPNHKCVEYAVPSVPVAQELKDAKDSIRVWVLTFRPLGNLKPFVVEEIASERACAELAAQMGETIEHRGAWWSCFPYQAPRPVVIRKVVRPIRQY
jgi:hypothetical protein